MSKLPGLATWFQKSGLAWTLKDLEKQLPSVGSISGMAVKDYLQGLSDENMIRTEKIGSGNWYWCFLSDEKIRKEEALSKAEKERDKAQATVEELQQKVDDASAAREEDEDEMPMEPGMDRGSLTTKHALLEKELEVLRIELAGYSENDPEEVERRRARIVAEKSKVDIITDQICSMESWYKKQAGGDKVQFLMMKKNWYGDEFDEESGGLREII